ncbi:MAG TPA: 1-(5-phosphoribosyl)-5-[(5-phosphoribosylamino)methylideneamino]imidazole-4-carboxamide isomerase [Planctomycetota bacterium]|nr:1-(5-phosphoribosyl)-5-[(5-phosphoribosylamino)methylideneamino]imidazole-4-carboxamide isomerase [Planctomycetota bacterium]
MLIIPAVDIKDGAAVRLKQGKAEEKTVYDANPVHAAKRWVDEGAARIHIVDLDGAFEGAPKNAALTEAILKAFGATHEIQIGGGLRSEEIIARFIDAGAARCVIGTKALDDRAFLERVAQRFPGKINVGIDAKDGMVVTQGWVEVSSVPATKLVATLAGLPLGEIIYTDIERDGMLQGPNLKRLEEMRDASPFPLIASGGVTTLENIRDCKKLNCFGAIVGKAFYDGRMQLNDALQAATNP